MKSKLLIYLFCGLLFVAGCEEKELKPELVPTSETSGTTGTLKWTLSEDSTLVIGGNGEMPDYEYLVYQQIVPNPPWYEHRNDITRVIVGDSVNKIGSYAFYNFSNLRSVTIGSSTTKIGIKAFEGCSSLSEIINKNKIPQPDGLRYIYRVLYDSVTLFVPAGSEAAYRATEWGRFLKIGAIGEPYVCSVIAGGVEKHGNTGYFLISWRLYDDGTLMISGIQMPDFNRIMLRWGTGSPEWVNYHYTTVIIEEGVENIGKSSFVGSNISSITIPSTVINISDKSYLGGINLVEIINHRETPQMISGDILNNLNKAECILFVPAGSIDEYRTAEGWKDFGNIKEIQ